MGFVFFICVWKWGILKEIGNNYVIVEEFFKKLNQYVLLIIKLFVGIFIVIFKIYLFMYLLIYFL